MVKDELKNIDKIEETVSLLMTCEQAHLFDFYRKIGNNVSLNTQIWKKSSRKTWKLLYDFFITENRIPFEFFTGNSIIQTDLMKQELDIRFR